MSVVEKNDGTVMARWSVGSVFLEGLAKRDFDRLAVSLGPAVRFRALLPPGLMEREGPEAVAEAFRSWFGQMEEFELLEATAGQVGGRLQLSWRIRVRPAPFDIGEGWHVIEQRAFADVGAAIDNLDLVCSGFRLEKVGC